MDRVRAEAESNPSENKNLKLLYGKPYTSDPRLNPEEEKLERQN